MTDPFPPSEPQPPQSRRSGFLPIVILLGIFFLIVLVMAILLLPDRGRRLLKLAEANSITQTLQAAAQPEAPASIHRI